MLPWLVSDTKRLLYSKNTLCIIQKPQICIPLEIMCIKQSDLTSDAYADSLYTQSVTCREAVDVSVGDLFTNCSKA